ncbi:MULTISPECIES: hypothetical protein [Flavobacterium]|uniref:Uncharacterized protein n=1 Tax=Flavobacterium jumunjinense TaxID=998845 RepID=A0ABV5GU96_9FLAO|nr:MULTISPECIES: hypothetical protein [Flavobacterium]
MKILLIIAIVAFIFLSIWIAKRNNVTAQFKKEPKLILTEKDTPIDFGYKTVWIAVKTNDKKRIIEILDLKNTQQANWKSGIEIAYNEGVFITPQVGQWTLVVGMRFMKNGGSLKDVNELEIKLNQLSLEFGEAQSFGTHRVVEYHHWMKSVKGKTVRIYSYLGEIGENNKVFGEPTKAEKGLNLFNSLSKEAASDSYWEQEDLVYADEELVMKIAEEWSINPTKLSQRNDVNDELGIIGN